jgi:UDP-N-acetylglucosamine 2-epimerase (non-hydrolysing)
MKIATFLGTRPELIRLSLVIPLLDAHAEHVLIDTGQNYDDTLSGLFYRELPVRRPDDELAVRASSFGEQAGQILARGEAALLRHRPDRVLILGDTNSGLVAIVARRLGIPVYHMEAGNRCFDDRVPEEVNRRIIDHSSTVLLPYTVRSKDNLVREGIDPTRIFVTGNPIKQVLDRSQDRIDASPVLDRLRVEPQRYFLVTAHRAENVDDERRLRSLMTALGELSGVYQMPVLFSVHPRTRSKLERFGVNVDDRAATRLLDPLGLFDFVKLQQHAFCTLSDSGTVQEEACIFGVPNVTIRDVTERPETIDCGSNILSGCDPPAIARAVRVAVASRGRWTPPAEYLAEHVAETVCRIVLGYRKPDAAELDWQAQSRA